MSPIWWKIATIPGLVSLTVFFTAFVIYPLAFLAFSRLKNRLKSKETGAPAMATGMPSIALLVSARNEERVIRKKIENCLELEYPSELLTITILSDGSTDRTVEITEEYRSSGVNLVHSAQWEGKNRRLNEAIAACVADIVLFTDTNALLRADAAREIAIAFNNPSTGCVTGRLVLGSLGGEDLPEASHYWKWETAIKRAESALGCTVASNGALLACRRELLPTLRDDTANDFYIPLHILAIKHRSVFADRAVAYEAATRDVSEEAARKERIMIRGMTCVSEMLSKVRPLIALHLLLRKPARWVAFPILIASLVTHTLVLAVNAQWGWLWFTGTGLTATTIIILMASRGWLGKTGVKVNYAFMIGRSSCAALIRFCKGERVSTWISPVTDR